MKRLATTALPLALMPLVMTPLAAAQEGAPARAQETQTSVDSTTTLAEAAGRWALGVRTGVLDAEAVAELEALRARTRAALEARPEDSALEGLLAQLEANRVDALSRVGDEKGARRAIEALRAAAGGEGPVARARRVALESPEITAVAERLSVTTELPQAEDLPASAALDRAVRAAVRKGDKSFVAQLGARAVPTLEVLARAVDGSPQDSDEVDPLLALLQLDPARGISVMRDLANRKDVLLKRRVAASLNAADVRGIDALWNPAVEDGPAPRFEGLDSLLLELMQEPGISPTVLRWTLRSLRNHGWVPDSLVASTVEVSRESPFNIQRYASLRPFAEAALQQDAPPARGEAASYLSQQEDPGPLADFVMDEQGNLRQSARSLLGRRWVKNPVKGLPLQGSSDKEVLPAVDAAYERLIIEIWSGPERLNPTQGLAIARDLVQRDGARVISAEALGELARRATDLNRIDSLMQYLRHVEKDVAVATFLIAFESLGPDGQVERDGESYSARRALLGRIYTVDNDTFWETVDSLEESGAVTAELAQMIAESASNRLNRREDDPLRFLAWIDRPGRELHEEMLVSERANGHLLWRETLRSSTNPELLERAVLATARYAPSYLKRGELEDMRLARLGAESLGRLLAADGVDGGVNGLLTGVRMAMDAGHAPAASATRGLEQRLVDHVMNENVERIDADLVRFLGGDGDRFLELVYSDTRRPKGEAAWVVSPGSSDDQWVERLLELFPAGDRRDFGSWGRRQTALWLVEKVFRGDRSDRLKILRELAVIDPKLAEKQIRLIQESLDSRDLPLVDTILESRGPGDSPFYEAVQTCVAFLSDESFAILMEQGKRTLGSEKDRKVVLEGIQTMLDWRAAAASWEASSSRSARRDQAVEQLVKMLEDPATKAEARAEALRGLGLLEAAEELPRLIKALGSDSDAIRTAAREAIDRLNATAK